MARRVEFEIGVAYDTDLALVAAVVVDALRRLDVVQADPPPTALVARLSSSTIDVVARLWVDSDQSQALQALDAAIRAVLLALDDAGVELPFGIVTVEAAESLGAALARRSS